MGAPRVPALVDDEDSSKEFVSEAESEDRPYLETDDAGKQFLHTKTHMIQVEPNVVFSINKMPSGDYVLDAADPSANPGIKPKWVSSLMKKKAAIQKWPAVKC